MQHLDWLQVALIFFIGIINAFFIHLFSKGQSKIAFVATIRALLQLLVLGFILQFLFDHDSWGIKILTIVIMVFNGSYTLKKRAGSTRESLLSFFGIMLLSVLPAISLAYVLLDYSYFSRPFFLIPYVGMLVGNSLTGLTLGINQLYEEIKRSKREIIFDLSFNLDQVLVAKDFFARSLKSGLTPVLNLMLVVGIVSIPGLMTGQMMAGTSPFLSARYQFFLIIAIEMTVMICLLLFYSFITLKMKNNEFYLMEVIYESD